MYVTCVPLIILFMIKGDQSPNSRYSVLCELAKSRYAACLVTKARVQRSFPFVCLNIAALTRDIQVNCVRCELEEVVD